MAIKRYKAIADNTIANGYQENLGTRATGSNMGQADVSEVYSIYGRQSTSSAEVSRIISQFDISSISTDRTAGTIPENGRVNFYLRMYNAETSNTVPRDFKLVVSAVSRSWTEGDGLDLENYKDKGSSNWVKATDSVSWTTAGGDYHESPKFEQSFETGLEDLELNVTSLIEEWIAGTKQNYGFGIQLTSSQEASSSANLGGATSSYYTKRFFARGTQYFFKKPVVEARWDSSTQDDRGDFYYSSSLAPAADNLNTIYLYNFVRGQLTNIPVIETGNIYVSLFSGSSSPVGSELTLHDGKTNVTGGYVSTGIYSCSVAITSAASPLKTIFDVWHNDSGTQYFTGTIKPATHYAMAASTGNSRRITKIKNLRNKYFSEEEARFNVYVRNKNWSPTIYTVASEEIENTIIPSASFRVYRVLDGLNVIPHGTGSDLQTLLSYDVSGNYFNLDMSLLEPGYEYGIKLAFYDSQRQSWLEQDQKFVFRVEDYEY
jgi:hypothetical protein